MKKTLVKIVAMALVLVAVAGLMASCGKRLSGKYEATAFGTGTVLEFKGNKVYAQFKIAGLYGDAVEGKYEIKDGKITLTFEGDEKAEALNQTADFEEGDGYIKIGIVKYTEVK